ncbi:MAG: hydroxyisourate hydrolase [Actinomycetes bacterium]
MTGITTHVLDTAAGRPAAGVAVRLLRGEAVVAAGATDADGRWVALDGPSTAAGAYRLVFATADHFGGATFHPQVVVDFTVADPAEHHHVPLLLSPYGYTTYRGS